MKKYTNDLKTMVEVVIFALLWFIGTTLDSPIVTIISFLFFICYINFMSSIVTERGGCIMSFILLKMIAIQK
ncbi:hypothetical protein FLBR109950_12765 [Flavobacterium branchiophilum]|uniref:hypothetical protein n=1 Tax=Flavobacterium branchiophilum TaxID=55197 RepID=UPI0002F1417C|nr:hypothetical protein [Flavobacterium branchiophilum]